jgi:peroxiredoxin
VDTYGVAWAGDDASFEAFVDRHDLSFANLSDADGEVFDHFGIATQPAMAVISPEGEVTSLPGALDEDELDQALERVTS